MSIIAFIVKCDFCDKLLDASEETYYETENDLGEPADMCSDCYGENFPEKAESLTQPTKDIKEFNNGNAA